MKKTSISYLLIAALFLSTIATVTAQDAEDPMWETIMIVPDNTKLKVLEENMRKHNQKYHKEGPYKSTVYAISTGPNMGKLVWMMGPLKYSHLDARPAAGGHDEDWRDNVMANVKKVEQGEYWTGDSKLSNTAMLTEDPGAYPILFTKYWEVESGHGFGVENHFKMGSEAIKAMEGVHPWGLYYNEFQQGNIGRHIATVSFFKNWTDFEKDWTFRKSFDSVHGENAWMGWIRNRDATFSNIWDEIWVYDKNMSGD
jgi:hypothetical protein